MERKNRDVTQNAKIVLTLATKDIVDAVKQRTVFINILFVSGIMLAYQWIPGLMYRDKDVLIAAEGDEWVAQALQGQGRYQPRTVPTLEALLEGMAEDHEGELGLAIPAGSPSTTASLSAESPGPRSLAGYVMWASRGDGPGLADELARAITEGVGEPVRINIEGTVVPDADSMGPIRLVAITLVVTLIFMGTLTIPHLMFEEKRTQTLQALLVSPASIGQVVLGKALAGGLFCLTTAAVALAFNWAFVANWGLMLLAVAGSALLAVGFGLVLGTFLERREQMMTWALIPGQILLGPVFLTFVDVILPDGLRQIMYWIPTVTLTKLFRYAFSTGATGAEILRDAGIVLVTGVVLLAAVVWKVRRTDR
jgi:ABC-2 type transport system permease protein